MRAAFLLPLAITLCACGEIPDQAPLHEEQSAPADPGEEALADAPTPSPIDGSMSGGGYPLADPDDLIPARYLGVWDYVEGTCAPESDLRIEISGREILFYEAIGIPTASRDLDNATYIAMAMEGEGEQWEEGMWLKLIDDETHLILTSGETPDDPNALPRKRCPA